MEANRTFLYLSSAASAFNSSSASGHRVHFVVQKSLCLISCWQQNTDEAKSVRGESNHVEMNKLWHAT